MPSRSAHAQPLSEVAIEVAQSCLVRLSCTADLSDGTVVHEIRVATKRLRAAWHLAAEQAGAERAKERRRSLADLAAKLSGTRDLAVLTRLSQRLAARQTDDRTAASLAHVAICLAQRHAVASLRVTPPAGLLDEIRAGLAGEVAAWQELGQEGHPARRRAIRLELRRSRRRARRAAREASLSLDGDVWHNWRKTVKRLRYQRQFVAIAKDRPAGRYDERLGRLGKHLGRRHDLTNLTKFAGSLLAAGELTAGHHGLVSTAIAAVESSLIRRCRRLGKRVFLR